jgi:pimeloyl-ACP methyl ester carboxylesterase
MYISIKDIRIYYETYGQGIPVLTLHGFPLDHQFMKKSLEPIFQGDRGTHFERFYFDLPGMGKSSISSSIQTTQDIVDICTKFIEKLISKQDFILIGESYGGYLARALTLHFRLHIIGLILISPVIYAEPEKRTVGTFKVIYSDSRLLNKLTEDEKKQINTNLVIQTQKNWERLNQEVLDPLIQNQSPFIKHLGLPKNYPLPYDVDDIEMPFSFPALILTGRQDNIVGYRDAFNILDNYSKGSYIVLNGAGHLLEIDQTQLYHFLCSHWFDQLP